MVPLEMLIDHRYQGKGYCQEVVRQVVELVGHGNHAQRMADAGSPRL